MFKQDHYVPIIRWKRGEQSALQVLDPSLKDFMTPVIEIPPIDWDFENDCPKKTVDDHLKNFKEQLKTSWNNDNPVFIDAHQICLDDDELMEDGSHPLISLFTMLKSEKLNAIPVTSPSRGVNYQKAVYSIVNNYQTGCAIRLLDEDFDDIDRIIQGFLEAFNVDPTEIDLIIDYRYIDHKNPVNRMTNLIVGSILAIPHINSWRTFTFVATAFPENLSEIKTGTDGSIPRSEWMIYQQLLQKKIPRYPSFGDYIISNPEYSRLDPRIMRMSANIRYTADNEYLIFRGYSVTTPKYGKWKQAQELCQRVVLHPKYSGEFYSFGDKYIYGCANETESNGNAETWRKIGTNHHLTLAINELSNFHASLSIGSP